MLEKIILIYIFIGMALAPAYMDMWYRICYKRNEFYNPYQVGFYMAFIIETLFWPIAFPVTFRGYMKEMTRVEKTSQKGHSIPPEF